jgi:hydrogenase-4 component B
LSFCVVLLAAWGAIGIAGLARAHSIEFVGRLLFPLGALVGFALALCALTSFALPPEQLVLPIGLPDLPFHLRLDALSGVFLMLLGVTSTGVSLFAAGYFRKGEGTPPGLLCLQYHLFLAGMGLVLLADDAYSFMVGWEIMAISSYFLVVSQHRLPEIRRAGFLYFVMAHVGALCILLSFGVLQGGDWQLTFDSMRGTELTPFTASLAFFLALTGFGAKAGLVPLHVWLPEAHPAAPSPVSALMSGVMLKTAVYGVLRVTFDLIGDPLWWWGLIALALGLFSAFYGVIFAAVQTDMKRLLAWSSIENIGVIFTGFGLTVIFQGLGMGALSLPESCSHEEPAVPGHRGRAACDRAKESRQAGRADPPHAMGRLADTRGCACDRGTAAIEWIRLRVAAAAVLPVHRRSAAAIRQHVAAGRRGGRCALRGTCRLCDGQVLRRDFPRPAA